MTFILEKIKETANVLKNRIVLSCTKIDDVKIISCGYKESNTIPSEDDAWVSYNGEALVAPKDSHWWVKFSVDVPKAAEKRIYRLYAMTDKRDRKSVV